MHCVQIFMDESANNPLVGEFGVEELLEAFSEEVSPYPIIHISWHNYYYVMVKLYSEL